MSLTDVMSAMQLELYAEVALVLFLAAFLVVVAQVLSATRKPEWQRARYLPLEDGACQNRRRAGQKDGEA